MKNWIYLALVVIVCLFNSGLTPAQQVLKPTDIPDSEPKAVLPAGAVVHVRLNDLGGTLISLDELIMSFVPEKAVPPEYQSHLEQQHPVLSLVGSQTVGEPISSELLGGIFGVDLQRPATISFYPTPDPLQGAVLSVPVSDFAAATGLLMNGLQAQKIEEIEVDDNIVYSLNSRSVGEILYVVCSTDTAYVCGSEQIATMLMSDGPRLEVSPVIQSAVNEHAQQDVNLIVDVTPFKPLVTAIAGQYETLPPGMVDRFLYSIFDNGLAVQVLSRLGIHDPSQLMGYLSVCAESTYEVLFDYLAEHAANADGLVASMDIGSKYQVVELSVFSSSISPEHFAQAITVNDVKQIVKQLPGSRSSISVTGQFPTPVRSQLLTHWLTVMLTKLQQKQLDASLVRSFYEFHIDSKIAVPLAVRVPWTATTSIASTPSREERPPSSVMEWFEMQFSSDNQVLPVTITAFPAQDDDFVQKHFASNAGALKATDTLYSDFLTKHYTDSRWLLRDFRSLHQTGAGGIQRVIEENSYIAQTNFFGYDEHEFVNRCIMNYRDVGGLTFMHRGRGVLPWLKQADTALARPVPPSINNLLAFVPKNANHVTIERSSEVVAGVLAALQKLEDIAHSEINDYVSAVNEIYFDASIERHQKQDLILSHPQPPFVQSLNWDREQEKLYCVLAGGLQYPRPKVVPIMADLTSEYREKSEEIGGVLVATSAENGRYSVVNVFSTDGAAYLVKTSVNRFFEQFVLPEDGFQKLRESLTMPNDGEARTGESVLVNPLWESLLRAMLAPQ